MALTKIQSVSIAANAITAAKIADGTVLASDILDGTITQAKLVNSTLDLGGAKVTGSVANTSISGKLTADQIVSVANTQISGLLTKSQIFTVANTQIEGYITPAQVLGGLGSMAGQDSSSVTITGGNITGVTTFGGNTTVAGNVDFDFNGAIAQNIVAVSSTSVDCSTGNYFTKTISTTTTFTFDNVPASRRYGFVLQLTNGGASTVNWPAAVVWPSATAPTLTSSGVDLLIFVTSDGGTTWRGSSLVNYAS